MIMEEKIKVKDILKDNYQEFKNRYWDRVPKVMRQHIDETVGKDLKCGDINTFGSDLKWNPHVHALVTDGAIDKKTKWWKPIDYIPYPYLKKSWQKVLLDIIKKHFNSYKTRQLVSYLYIKYPKGFYVNAKRKLDDTRQAVKYIGRYLARAAIAEYRIMKYENNRVKFWYEDHNDGVRKVMECDVLEFIGKITQHIAPKGFRMVRRYGLYSRKNNKLSKEIIHLYNFVKQRKINELLEEKKKQNGIKKSWKERIIESFGGNPLICGKCGTEKFLWKIWHKNYGVIYYIREINNRKDVLYEPKRDKVHRKILQISLL